MQLNQVPERRQIFSFALRGALEILQMPQLELASFLLEQIEKNPILQLSESKSIRFEGEVPAPIYFHEHLLSQIREILLEEKERKVAYALVEHLDEKGYLCTSYKILEEQFPIQLEPILSILQSLDPPGIFARSLQESFLLQLKAKGKKDLLAHRLIETCFDDLLHRRYSLIKKKLGESNIEEAIQDLAHLSLHPISRFKKEPPSSIRVDLRILKNDRIWSLELIEEDLPKFHIAEEYLKLEGASLEEEKVLREWKVHAKWITHSLKRRRNILLQIGKTLLRKQSHFLEGKGELAPLSPQELCEELEIHESTLSRALSGKYAATPRGILLLKSLITKTPQTLNTKQALEHLVQFEDKKDPLTDERLSQLLKEKGFNLSRRTVAKYRAQLKIPYATQRRFRSLSG